MSAQLDSLTTYRQMTEADLVCVVCIEEAVHRHPWTRGNFVDCLAEGHQCWVVLRGGQTVGYGVVGIAAGEAHLLNLSIASASQRQGLGAEFTRFLVGLAREGGASRLILEVRPSNAAARALYASYGFAEIGVRRGYYPEGEAREDAVVMALELA